MSLTQIRESFEKDIFASTDWTNRNIPTYPLNYYGPMSTNSEHIRTHILPAQASITQFDGAKETNGLLIISIFVDAGKGQTRVFEISDALDEFLSAKKLKNNVLTKGSFLTFAGLDPDNKSLYRADYTLPFTQFR